MQKIILILALAPFILALILILVCGVVAISPFLFPYLLISQIIELKKPVKKEKSNLFDKWKYFKNAQNN